MITLFTAIAIIVAIGLVRKFCWRTETFHNEIRRENSNTIVETTTFSVPVTGTSTATTETPVLAQIPTVLRNFEPSICQFCSVKLITGKGVMLQDCLHVFCENCLKIAIETRKDECQIPCPIADETDCGGILLELEIKHLVRPEVFQEYLDRSLTHAKLQLNVFTCKSKGCKSWCDYEEGRKIFNCPECKQQNCLACHAIHTGLDCQKFKGLSLKGQYSKIEELMVHQRKNDGWEQLIEIFSKGTNDFDANTSFQNSDVLENTMNFECSICFNMDVLPGEGAILQECLHMFCKECLVNLVEYNEDVLVKCPYIDGNYSCVGFLQPREIKALVPPDIYEKHLELSERLGESSIENTYHCKTPDCKGWCVFDEGATKFLCPRCKKYNCITCQSIHSGSCEDFQNRLKQNANHQLSEEAVERMIKAGTCMRCPKCKIPVQKTSGCDAIKCSVCKLEICWVTKGPRWGPKGKGDISAGCRCKVNGQKCHPNCGNCH